MFRIIGDGVGGEWLWIPLVICDEVFLFLSLLWVVGVGIKAARTPMEWVVGVGVGADLLDKGHLRVGSHLSKRRLRARDGCEAVWHGIISIDEALACDGLRI